MNAGFSAFARRLADLAGHAGSFALAVAAVVAWALSGPLFHYSDTWQLVINTSTTILTLNLPSVSLHHSNDYWWYWNIYQLSIAYALRLGLGPDLP